MPVREPRKVPAVSEPSPDHRPPKFPASLRRPLREAASLLPVACHSQRLRWEQRSRLHHNRRHSLTSNLRNKRSRPLNSSSHRSSFLSRGSLASPGSSNKAASHGRNDNESRSGVLIT